MSHEVTAVTRSPSAHAAASMREARGGELAEPPCLPPCDDMTALLARAAFTTRDAQESAARGEIGTASTARDLDLQHAREAEQQAAAAQAEAQSKAHWVKVASTAATIAGAVVAVASVVVSGGASAPAVIALAGMMLSASSSLASGKTQTAMMYTGVAMSAGAGVYQLGTALAADTATAAATAAEKQVEASMAQRLAMWVGAGARVTEGSARGVQGGATIAQKRDEAQCASEQADAKLQRADGKLAQGRIEEVIERLQQVEASTRRAVSVVIAVAQEMDQTRGGIIARMASGVLA